MYIQIYMFICTLYMYIFRTYVENLRKRLNINVAHSMDIFMRQQTKRCHKIKLEKELKMYA